VKSQGAVGRKKADCAIVSKGRTYLLWVLESTMSRNSWLVGTAGMSFHWVFILATAVCGCRVKPSALPESLQGKKVDGAIDTVWGENTRILRLQCWHSAALANQSGHLHPSHHPWTHLNIVVPPHTRENLNSFADYTKIK
jgi:hypothetical protein